MPSTASTNLTLPTLLDLIGPAMQSPASDKGSSAFDALLSAPAAVRRPADPPTGSNTAVHRQPSANDRQVEAREASSPSEKNESSPEAAKVPVGDKAERDDEKDANEALIDAASAEPNPKLPATTEFTTPLPIQTNDTAFASEETFKQDATADGRQTVAGRTTKRGGDASAQQIGMTQSDTEASHVADEKAAERFEQQSKATAPELTKNQQQSLAATHSDASMPAPGDHGSFKPLSDARSSATSETETISKNVAAPEDATDKKPDQQSIENPSSTQSQDQSLSPLDRSKPEVAVAAAPVIATGTPPGDTKSAKPAEANPAIASNIGPRRSKLPGEMLTTHTTAATRKPTVEVDSTRLLTRVARALSAAQAREGEVRLRLSPSELGSLKLEIRVQDGAMVARLEAETDLARAAIIDSLPALRERLAEQGVRIERFDVDLMQRQPGGSSNQSDQRPNRDMPGAVRVALPTQRNPQPATATANVPRATTALSGLNVIV